jgi:hypothetical protein
LFFLAEHSAAAAFFLICVSQFRLSIRGEKHFTASDHLIQCNNIVSIARKFIFRQTEAVLRLMQSVLSELTEQGGRIIVRLSWKQNRFNIYYPAIALQ